MYKIYAGIILIYFAIIFSFIYLKSKKHYSALIRFNSIEDEREYAIETLRYFRDCEINFNELDNSVCEVNFEYDPKLHDLLEAVLDNPFIELYASSEHYEYLTRIMDFIRSGEKYPRYGGCWCRGCLINMFVRVFTLGICSYRKYQIFLRVTQVRSEKFWPFKSEHHYLEVMKKLHEK